MTKRPPSYYWDSSVFLMVLKGETCHGPGVLDAAGNLLRAMMRKEIVIVTSQITLTEVLPTYIPPDAYERFLALFENPCLVPVAVDFPISRLAGEIRHRCLQAAPSKVVIQVADAIHVATALNQKVTAIHCLDGDFNRALEYAGSAERAGLPAAIQLGLGLEMAREADAGTQ